MFVDGGLDVLHTGQELFLHPGERHHLDTERLAQRATGRLQEEHVHDTQSRGEYIKRRTVRETQNHGVFSYY